MSIEDLTNEGVLGLMRAIEMFDPDKGFNLSTYSRYWVDHFCIRAIQRHKGMSATYQARWSDFVAYKKVVDELGHEAAIKHAAAERGCGESSMSGVVRALSSRSVSTSQPLREDSDATIGDFLVNESNEDSEAIISRLEAIEFVTEAIDHLPNERVRDVARSRFLDPDEPTLDDIGARYGITRERVRQLEAQAMKAIRGYIEDREDGYKRPPMEQSKRGRKPVLPDQSAPSEPVQVRTPPKPRRSKSSPVKTFTREEIAAWLAEKRGEVATAKTEQEKEPGYVPQPAQEMEPASFELADPIDAPVGRKDNPGTLLCSYELCGKSVPVDTMIDGYCSLACKGDAAEERQKLVENIDRHETRLAMLASAANVGRTAPRNCIDCGSEFRADPGRGRAPDRCQTCRCKPRKRAQQSERSGRTETRVCKFSECGKTFTHTCLRGTFPIYCSPDCARMAENEADRARRRVKRVESGMVPNKHIVAEIVHVVPRERHHIESVSAIDEQRALMKRIGEVRDRLVNELHDAEQKVIELRNAIDELDGEARKPLIGAVGIYEDGERWGLLPCPDPEELRQIDERDPLSVHTFEVFLPESNGRALAIVRPNGS